MNLELSGRHPGILSRIPMSCLLGIGLAGSAIVLLIEAIPPEKLGKPFSWDLLLLTGFATLIAGLLLAGTSRERFERMLDRLARRGVIPDAEAVKSGMEKQAQQWMQRVAACVSLVIALTFAWVIAFHTASSDMASMISLAVFETFWAYVAGWRIARMVVYGRLGWYLRDQGVPIHATPGHIDGAGGLKPLGAFFLNQAAILGLPAAFLAIWSVLIPAWPDLEVRTRYLRWAHPYLGLLGVAIVIEMLAFVVPLWWIHREMRSQKHRLLSEADRLGQRIQDLRAQIAQAKTDDERKSFTEELKFAKQQFWNIERMPEWPIDISVFRKFTFGNAALILPLIAESAGIHEKWVELLSGAFGKMSQ